MKRVQITGVVITTKSPDGKEKIYNVNPEKVEAIFWSDRAINQMLASFYDINEKIIPVDEVKEVFEESSLGLIDNIEKDVLITSNLIKSVWHQDMMNGFKPGFILKNIDCTSTPPNTPR